MASAPCALTLSLNNPATIWFDARFKFASSPGSPAGDLMGGRKWRVSFASSGKQIMRSPTEAGIWTAAVTRRASFLRGLIGIFRTVALNLDDIEWTTDGRWSRYGGAKLIRRGSAARWAFHAGSAGQFAVWLGHDGG
jgi:hypothetical protein